MLYFSKDDAVALSMLGHLLYYTTLRDTTLKRQQWALAHSSKYSVRPHIPQYHILPTDTDC